MDNNDNPYLDFMNKKWSHDLLSLSNEEIRMHIQNLFYQMFLIDITNFNMKINFNEDSCHVTFNISGEALHDSNNPTDLEYDECDDFYEED
jgi:hypothetical protein